MKSTSERFRRARRLFARLLAAFAQKPFRTTRFAKYEVVPRLDVPAMDRRLYRKLRSLFKASSANHQSKPL